MRRRGDRSFTARGGHSSRHVLLLVIPLPLPSGPLPRPPQRAPPPPGGFGIVLDSLFRTNFHVAVAKSLGRKTGAEATTASGKTCASLVEIVAHFPAGMSSPLFARSRDGVFRYCCTRSPHSQSDLSLHAFEPCPLLPRDRSGGRDVVI